MQRSVVSIAALLLVPAVVFAAPSRTTASSSCVIVTDASLAAAFAPLAAAHTAGGLPTTVHTLQDIQAAYPSGRDDAERIRFLLRDLHTQSNLKYVLIGGDEPLIPMRRVCLHNSLVVQGDLLLPTDQYYACLTGDWNADNDALWGEDPGDDVTYVPDVHVGRAPVTTLAEAQAFVTRTIAALGQAPPTPDVVMAANHFGPVDLASSTETLVPKFALLGSPVTRLYHEAGSWPGSLPESKASLLAALQQGFDIAVLAGNGGAGIFQAGGTAADYVVPGDLLALTNPSPLTHAWFLSACTTTPGTSSIGAALLRNPNGGAVTVIGPVDLEFVTISTSFMQSFFDQAYQNGAESIGEALSRAIVATGNAGDAGRLTTQGNLLLGDPALTLPGMPGGVVPVALALVSADASSDRVRLVWFDASARTGAADVERRTENSAWARIDRVAADGEHRLTFEDRDLVPGERYGYRLAIGAPGSVDYAGETWVTIPRPATLALAGARPNPASRSLAIHFTLPDARSATLDLLDIGGRVIRTRDVGTLGAGDHVIDLGEGRMPPPGVYLVRLHQGAGTIVRRVGVVR